jgi:hypothetical protein
MSITNDYTDSASYESWQSDPSTRTAVQPWDRYVPFSGSVSTTAADLINIFSGPYYDIDQGATTANLELPYSGSPGVNRILNPSIEHATISEFTAVGSAISRTTGAPFIGSAELTCNPENSAAKEGFTVTTDLLAGGTSRSQDSYLCAQGMVRGASASGDAVIQILDSSDTVLATGEAVNLTTSYQRVSVHFKLPTGAAAYKIKFCSNSQHNINMLWDALMYDKRINTKVIDYIDGNLAGGNTYQWEGTTDLSRSRHLSPIGAIRGISIRNTHASNVLYVAFDTVAEASTAAIKLTGNDTTEHNFFVSTHPLDFRKNISVIASGSSTTYEGVIWGVAAPVG